MHSWAYTFIVLMYPKYIVSNWSLLFCDLSSAHIQRFMCSLKYVIIGRFIAQHDATSGTCRFILRNASNSSKNVVRFHIIYKIKSFRHFNL